MVERLEELRRRLDQKTTEIESLLTAERGMGSIYEMDPSDYHRLQQDVEIEQMILTSRGDDVGEDELRCRSKNMPGPG